MAVYDYNGTAAAEIGKVYDNDGTAAVQIGEIYDSDGTAAMVLYTAGEAKTFIPNAEQFPKEAWTVVMVDGNNAPTSNAHAISNTDIEVRETDVYFKLAARENGGWTAYTLSVNADGLSVMTIKGSIPSNADAGTLYVGLFSNRDNPKVNTMLRGYTAVLKKTAVNIDVSYDIADIEGEVYLMVGVYGSTTGYRAWGHVTITELSVK